MVNWDTEVKNEQKRIAAARKELAGLKAQRSEVAKGAKRVIAAIEATLKEAEKVEDQLTDDIGKAEFSLGMLEGEAKEIEEAEAQLASVDKTKDLKPLIKQYKLKADASPDDVKKHISLALKKLESDAKAYLPEGWADFENHVSEHEKAVNEIRKVVDSCNL